MKRTTISDTLAYIAESLNKNIPNLEFYLKTHKENATQKMESIVLIIDSTDNIKIFFDQLLTILSNSLSDKYICKTLQFKIFTLLSDDEIKNSDLSIYAESLRGFYQKVSVFKLQNNQDQNEAASNFYLLKVFETLKDSSISLFLTPDMLIKRAFFKKMFNYCTFSDKFLISGAQIYNKNYLDAQEFFSMKNSSVCLYATGHPAFHSLIDTLTRLIGKYEIFKYINLNFLIDTFITSLKVNFRNIPEKNQDICEYIISNYKYNNYISNISHNTEDCRSKVMKIPGKLSVYASNIQPGIYCKKSEYEFKKTFDPKFYAKMYPNTPGFLKNQKDLSEEDKLFRHYMSFGLNYGFWPNEDLYNQNRLDYK